MTEAFNDRLERICRERNSNLCVGLDPDISKLSLAEAARLDNSAPELDLCRRVARATVPYAAAFKPNAAFFEATPAGAQVMAQLHREIAAASPDVIRLCDAKRGDIGNTSARYADAAFRHWHSDSITVNPLMGYDSVAPFLDNPARGVFLLCLTSNSGAEDFLLQNDLYKRIAEKANTWNRNGNVGLVVGATQPQYVAGIREIAPDLPLLIPGVGAQGGSLSETLDAINAKANRRFLINASRSIMYPEVSPADTYEAATAGAAQALCEEIRNLLN